MRKQYRHKQSRSSCCSATKQTLSVFCKQTLQIQWLSSLMGQAQLRLLVGFDMRGQTRELSVSSTVRIYFTKC